MKYVYAFIMTMIVFTFSHHAKAETIDLQNMIDHAGDVLTLEEGEYLANVTIHRPIKIVANGNVTLKPVNSEEPIITISKTKDVSIDGLHLETPKNAIQIKDAQKIKISNVSIEKVHSGIELFRTKNIEIRNISVTGNDKHYADKGNGISVFNSKDISVEGNKIHKVQDGVYVEEVREITVKNNYVDNSRYGTHFMYSENATAIGNDYTKNVTGLMVMMTNNVTLKNNDVSYQEGFNGTGITLFDVGKVDVVNNKLAGNRIAITLQKTSKVDILKNLFQMNQTAIESIRSDQSNKATENFFVGNLVNARSDTTGLNLMKNYYDDYSGIDVNDDGIGDESYVGLQSFGQWMVRKPVYQYYVEAPSVVILKEIDKVTNKSAQQLLVDETPMTDFKRNQKRNSSIDILQLSIGLLLVTSCIVVWRRSAWT